MRMRAWTKEHPALLSMSTRLFRMEYIFDTKLLGKLSCTAPLKAIH